MAIDRKRIELPVKDEGGLRGRLLQKRVNGLNVFIVRAQNGFLTRGE